jgi:peptidoglycan/LPS O-acetylase OafA/YrhL
VVERIRAATLALFLPGGTAGNRLAILDTVRAFAVLAVVVHHTWYVAGSPPLPLDLGVKTISLGAALSGAGLGVDIFFVLSGFLLSMPWHRAFAKGAPRPNLSRYFLRRFLRIVPPYWFMLLVMGLLMAGTTIPWTAIGSSDGLEALLAHVFFVQYLFPSTSGGFAAVNGSVWTLTIEMIFYVTLPLLVLGFLGGRWRYGLPISIVFSLFWVWLSWHHLGGLVDYWLGTVDHFGVSEAQIRYFLSTQFLAFVGEFGIGIAAAGWWIRRDREIQLSPTLQWLAGAGAILAGIGALAAMYLVGAHGGNELVQVFARMSVAAGVGLLIMGLLAGPELLRRPLDFLPFRLYGVIGYSVFLWHLPILTVMATWPIFASEPSAARFWEILAYGLPLTTLFGVVLYLLVERPFLIARPGPLKGAPQSPELGGEVKGAPRAVVPPEAW